jgi:hypothetical protein
LNAEHELLKQAPKETETTTQGATVQNLLMDNAEMESKLIQLTEQVPPPVATRTQLTRSSCAQLHAEEERTNELLMELQRLVHVKDELEAEREHFKLELESQEEDHLEVRDTLSRRPPSRGTAAAAG